MLAMKSNYNTDSLPTFYFWCSMSQKHANTALQNSVQLQVKALAAVPWSDTSSTSSGCSNCFLREKVNMFRFESGLPFTKSTSSCTLYSKLGLTGRFKGAPARPAVAQVSGNSKLWQEQHFLVDPNM